MMWIAAYSPLSNAMLCWLSASMRIVSRFLLQNPVDNPFVQIMRAAHVVKGAASNLMCGQLRHCAMNLENVASAASGDPSSQSNPAVLQNVQARYQELQVAVQNYKAYLQSLGV
jgi:HPt (histidine-containing phosphotransfer) domain-containing protein